VNLTDTLRRSTAEGTMRHTLVPHEFFGDQRLSLMNITKNLGMLLLAIYLIIIGLSGTFGFNLGQLSILVPILAIAAGVVILLGK
jgi:hypothetical protein